MKPMQRHEALKKLFLDYIEGALDDEVHAELTAHLDECPECDAFVESYRATIRVTHKAGDVTVSDMPDELQRRLRSFLATHMARGGEKASDES